MARKVTYSSKERPRDHMKVIKIKSKGSIDLLDILGKCLMIFSSVGYLTMAVGVKGTCFQSSRFITIANILLSPLRQV